MNKDSNHLQAESDRQDGATHDGFVNFSDASPLSEDSVALFGDVETDNTYSKDEPDRAFEWGETSVFPVFGIDDAKTSDNIATNALADNSYVDYAAIEAILMVATEPVRTSLIAEIMETTPDAIERACEVLQASYEAEGRGFELVKIAGGYRYQSSAQYKDYVERFIIRDMPQKLSPAALETLAIIAYKQPITRAQVASIRGVNVDRVVRLLLQKDLIKEVGKDTGPGQAIFFGTTDLFLERLGLNSLDDLPPLEEYVPDVATVEALEHVLRDKP